MQIDMGINSTYSPSLNLSLCPAYSQPRTDESAYVAPEYAGRLSVSTVDDGVNAFAAVTTNGQPHHEFRMPRGRSGRLSAQSTGSA